MGLGYFYGWGYCLLTDWHWEIKRKLGEVDLPSSFVSYSLDKMHIDIPSSQVDLFITVAFFVAYFLGHALYLKNRLQLARG